MTPIVCDCGDCRVCDIRGLGKPRPPSPLAADAPDPSDPRVKPARKPRGKATPGPTLFDAPAPKESP